ncbi:hypothetical protein ACFV3R_33200 [Streptomyces sp. NPDC059740]|uniref:hypothetical protein n=1 Tax=Streptomyces sp. NPDC059740 TaxID=3346926 RepID=UPI003663E821
MSLLAGALVGGCSTEGAVADDGPPAARASAGREGATAAVRGSADALVRAGSSRVRTTMETVSGGTRVAIRGTGVFDYGTGRGRLELVLPEPAEAGTDGGRPITEVFVPGALYMKNRGAGVPADKWVRIDTGGLTDGNFVTGGATDPLSAAELLRGAREVRLLGEERLDGVAVRHYRGTADFAAAARAVPAARAEAGAGRDAAVRASHARAALTAAAKGFSGDGVTFDVYLDRAGRLRKAEEHFVFVNGTPGGSRVTSTTVLAGFGTPVHVTLPDPADLYAGEIESPGG